MNGIHDMGGMHGFGPIVTEEDEPVFHHAWEGRVYAMRQNIPMPIPGGKRYAIERLDQAFYLASSYYGRWLYSGINSLIEAGAFSQAEFDERLASCRANPKAVLPRQEDPEAVQRVVGGIWSTKTQRREVIDL